MSEMSRRQLLLSLPALAIARRSMASQPAAPATIRVRTLSHFGLAVSDQKRSIEFYQGLFGMPVQARIGETTLLRVGTGPQFISIAPAGNAAPTINHFCLGVDGFDVDRVMAALAARGGGGGGGDAAGPMKAAVTRRGPDAGGAKEGTPELLFGDPDGIICQLQDASFCGGAGALGNMCPAPEPPPKKGAIALRDLSHLTIFATDAGRSNTFYRDLFGLSIRSYQGPTAPTLAVGPTVQFLMFTGGGGGARGAAPSSPPRPASINHGCFSMDGFKPDEVVKSLESYGLRPREGATGPVGPLRHYVSMRMENRGGAPGDTPEQYFTDPDGLLMQLQDTTYCGGGGFLGDTCK
jgi:catechol 2,3-dioxygenase-like lactoylglutathione lyase family enzyme